MNEQFPLPISAMLRGGIAGYVKNLVPLTAAAAVTFSVSGLFGYWAQASRAGGAENELTASYVALYLIGLVLAGTVSLPWFAYALDAARGYSADIAAPWRSGRMFAAQFVCSVFFWAGFLLGAMLFAIPSILAVLFYGFSGYVVADRAAKGGLRALGTSVRLGTKRRIALFAIMALFAAFNLLAAIPMGYGVSLVTVVLTLALLTVTASITLVSWACLYDVLTERLGDQ
ncbi:hypothetical protein [Candidatus Poriferisodalis sp.]|uniref:hypothetical protein n=1 Tax=Candidatus Poriferisodalis sp. TaxID=3101277 RepID=UPI003B02D5D5